MDSDYYLSGLFDQVTIQALTAGPVIALSLAILLLLVSGFVSASEVAFFSLTPGDINDIREENAPSDPLIQRLLDRSEYLLAAILIANNFVNVAVVMLCTYGINAIVDFSSAPDVGLYSGDDRPDLSPFVVRRDHAEDLCTEKLAAVRAQFGPCTECRGACLPAAFEHIGHVDQRHQQGVSQEEVRSFGRRAFQSIGTHFHRNAGRERDAFGDHQVLQQDCRRDHDAPAWIWRISTSRRVSAPWSISSSDPVIPVFRFMPIRRITSRESCISKTFLPYVEKPDTFRWQSLIRPAYFVPETKKIDDLLEEFRTSKIHMAIVVDEFGGTSGIVTMEDILEEIVGEISDEYDEDEKQFIRLADGSLIFEAKILLTDFFRVIDADPTEFGKLTEEVETLAGLLLEIKGDFPRRREIIEYDDYRFQVLEIDNRRILKVKFNRISDQGKERQEE